MTGDELEAIRARAEAAAPGPWEAEIGAEIEVNAGSARTTWDGDIGRPATSWRSVDRILEVADADEELDDDEYEIVSANAEFIAHARDDIPALLDEVFRLRALVGEPEWEPGVAGCSGCAHECEGDTGHPVPTDMPGFEGTREALDALTIKPGGDGE